MKLEEFAGAYQRRRSVNAGRLSPRNFPGAPPHSPPSSSHATEASVALRPATPPTDRDNWMGHDRGAALEHTIQRCEHSDVDALASMLRNPSLTNVMHL